MRYFLRSSLTFSIMIFLRASLTFSTRDFLRACFTFSIRDFLRTTLTFSIRDAKQSENGVLADRCGVADDRQLGDKSMMKILMVTLTMLCRTKLIMVIFFVFNHHADETVVCQKLIPDFGKFILPI